MAKRDILKEAIADAKTVKETAIANAKAALEEAFTPRLKEMLATKLEEMELEEEAEVEEGYSNKDGLKDDSPTEIKSEKGRFNKSGDVSEGDDKDPMEEEINLDEILAELDEEMDKDTLNEDEATDKEEEGYLDGKKDGEEEEKEDMEDEEIDLEDMSDDDLKGFIEDVIADMVASGDLEAGENFEEEDETEEIVDTTDVDVEISEDEEVKEIELDEAKAKEEDDKKEKVDESEIAEVYKAKEEMEEELKEAYSTIETLKSDLNEVNLLNAKLLYTNKIFKAKTLTESQKVKVLGAFDKAGTVKETKLVFETLSEGLKAKKKSPIKESLGTASRVSRSINTKKPIIETDPMVARFQKLAGLK